MLIMNCNHCQSTTGHTHLVYNIDPKCALFRMSTDGDALAIDSTPQTASDDSEDPGHALVELITQLDDYTPTVRGSGGNDLINITFVDYFAPVQLASTHPATHIHTSASTCTHPHTHTHTHTHHNYRVAFSLLCAQCYVYSWGTPSSCP